MSSGPLGEELNVSSLPRRSFAGVFGTLKFPIEELDWPLYGKKHFKLDNGAEQRGTRSAFQEGVPCSLRSLVTGAMIHRSAQGKLAALHQALSEKPDWD